MTWNLVGRRSLPNRLIQQGSDEMIDHSNRSQVQTIGTQNPWFLFSFFSSSHAQFYLPSLEGANLAFTKSCMYCIEGTSVQMLAVSWAQWPMLSPSSICSCDHHLRFFWSFHLPFTLKLDTYPSPVSPSWSVWFLIPSFPCSHSLIIPLLLLGQHWPSEEDGGHIFYSQVVLWRN